MTGPPRAPGTAVLVSTPEKYEWSSARFHPDGRRADPLVADGDRDLMGLVDSWTVFLQDGMDEVEAKRLERALSAGLALGSAGFVERRYRRRLTVGRPGRPRRRRGRDR